MRYEEDGGSGGIGDASFNGGYQMPEWCPGRVYATYGFRWGYVGKPMGRGDTWGFERITCRHSLCRQALYVCMYLCMCVK